MAWDLPPNFDELCLHALLLYGPMPVDGWRHSGEFGTHGTNKAARLFKRNIISFMRERAQTLYGHKGWTSNYLDSLSRMWANQAVKKWHGYRDELQDTAESAAQT